MLRIVVGALVRSSDRTDLGDELRPAQGRTTLGPCSPGIVRLAGEAHGSRWHRYLRAPRPCGGRSERYRLTTHPPARVGHRSLRQLAFHGELGDLPAEACWLLAPSV